ncbi:hypothetical protein PGT21_019788 [Puccinia graminis f. sp. tritici]|uniref:Uncharacterized protein n=1 Tax=Puccinia graminis f. sp. tritici TaxID=56615 RepID=A0A5B0Q5X3_PUCGR|nr:hypothetical protein PGT21_019788 [Puccinia graminis f. sp. tritici]
MNSFLMMASMSVLVFLLLSNSFHSLVDAKSTSSSKSDSSSTGSSSSSSSSSSGKKTGEIFPFRKYEDFQISDGVAGQAFENAGKVFVEPFAGVPLEKITKGDMDNLLKMARAARQNELLFNQALKKAKGSNKSALAAGKIANKVLKLVGEIQVIELQKKLNIKQVDVPAKLAEHQKKLTKNTKVDRSNKGKKMVSYLSTSSSSSSSSSGSGSGSGSGTGSGSEKTKSKSKNKTKPKKEEKEETKASPED